MFGIGGFELFIILVFGFLIFGPDKLPEIAKTVGKGIARFRAAQEEMNGVIKSTDIFDPNDPEQPFKDPVEALDKLAKHQEEKKSGKKVAATKAASGADSASAPAAASGTAAASSAKQESFTERKARYERERAARKAAEAKAAEEAAKAEEAAAAGESESAAKPEPASAPAADAEPASAPASTPATEGGDE